MLELVHWVSWFGALVSAMGALAGCKSRPKAELVSDPAGDMIRLPEATLKLGKGTAEYDTDPLRTVTVNSVAIDVTVVTVAAYRRCVEVGPCSVPGGPHSFAPGTRESCYWGVPGKDNHPVNCVDFNQAVTYCSWARSCRDDRRGAQHPEDTTAPVRFCKECRSRLPRKHNPSAHIKTLRSCR